MNVWGFLFKKEIRLMRSFWMTAGLVILLISMMGGYLATRFHSGVPSLILFMLMFFHSFYLLLYLLVSLRKETRNLPIWMQSPQSGILLLSVKFGAGFLLMLGSLVLSLLLWLWVVNLDIQTSLYQGGAYFQSLTAIEDLIKEHWILSFVVFAQRGLFLAGLGVLLYFSVDLLKYTLKGWRWLLGFGLFIAGVFITIWFSNTELFAFMFHWGKLDLSDFSTLSSSGTFQGPPIVTIFRSFFPSYAGDIIFKFLLAAVCFFISTWLLDRKVEV
ncbi:hypothetical protein [Oceanobacillus neutriphilus]|uniref:ABC-2 family transporter protein n=1 Tax=Oceanobacillus neutriphilus TaxID=531815 RepID=A0ABQ2P2J1_9BACI|nr:hypothetical protein [Oceanobacillus neutriphilus]GGP16367.1 hypothetical protein GCM10011346_48080 [Oceanobacillus neutriphilus]